MSGEAGGGQVQPQNQDGQAQGQAQNQDGQGQGRRGGRGGGRGRGRGGYGSVVDVGAALLALTPEGNLVVFAPDREAFKELARYKVAERGTYAYPVAAGTSIYIKDQDSLTRWTVE